jgi:hypothetical protein
MQMSPEHSALRPVEMMRQDVKWSRSLRLTVAFVSAVASWAAVFGITYLVAQFF